MILVFGEVHHEKFIDFCFPVGGVVSLVELFLSVGLQVGQGLERQVFQELLHGHAPLLDVSEEFLCMRTSLSACARSHVLLHLLPVLAMML